jgi:hypothetical protein
MIPDFIFTNMLIMYLQRQLDWGSFQAVTFPFSCLDGPLMLYVTLVRCKVEYAAVVWNSITYTDASKLEHIQWRFLSLLSSSCFYSYTV